MGWWSRSSGISRATFLNPYSLSAAFLRESPPKRRGMPSESHQGRHRGSRTRKEQATAVPIRSHRMVPTDRCRESMGAIDSKHSLDDSRKGRDIRPMENAENCAERKVQMLLLERRDKSRNMARFYVLAIEPTLFGDSASCAIAATFSISTSLKKRLHARNIGRISRMD